MVSFEIKVPGDTINICGFLLLATNLPICKRPFGFPQAHNYYQYQPSIELSPTSNNATLAREWIKWCVEGHPQCRSLGTPSTRPSRLLFVEDRGDQLHCQLQDGSSLAPDIPYLTLSHCWGHGVSFKLTVSNIKSLQREVPIERLPLTFRQTLELVVNLGFNYVWIDSLCIIQDSPVDWAFEAARMRDVYKYAFCNIAATASANSGEGLFRERITPLIPPLQLDVKMTHYVPVLPDSRIKKNTKSGVQKPAERMQSGGRYYLCEQ